MYLVTDIWVRATRDPDTGETSRLPEILLFYMSGALLSVRHHQAH